MTLTFARIGSRYEKEHLQLGARCIKLDIQEHSWQGKQERRFAPTFFGSNSDLIKLEQVISINWIQRSHSAGLGDLFHRNTHVKDKK